MPRRRKVAVEKQENEADTNKNPEKSTKSKGKPAKKQKSEPEWLQGDGLNISQLVLSVQKTDCNHVKVIAELTKLYNKMGHKAFMAVFMKMINLYLIREENDECSARMMKFFGTFVASFGEEVNDDGGSHLIVQRVFKEILSITSKLFYVRARICLLVTQIMTSFSQKAEIDEAIMDDVITRMIGTFIKDISPVVRQYAIMALQRLQDPENPEDQVTRAYLYHMESDPVSKVRQATITAIAKKLPIFPNIFDRLHDNDEKVRRHTYFQMASVPVKSYKIADRIQIMLAGLYDRSELVKKAVHNILIPNWIASYDNIYTDFIKAIKLDSNDNELLKFRSLAQDALNVIFKKRKIGELIKFLNLSEPENEFQNCLSIEKTNSLEWLIMWKVVIKLHQDYAEGRVHKEDDDEDGEKSEDEHNETIANVQIFPELSVFCGYIEKFIAEFKVTTESEAKYQKLNFNHCLIVLLEIAQLNDFGDEIGRNRLQEVLKKILIEHDVSEHVIQEIIHVMETLIPNLETRVKFFNDIVTDMLNLGSSSEYSRQTILEELISQVDIDMKVKARSLTLEMMELKEQESVFVNRKQYGEAQNVSEKYTQLNEELIELLRPYAESSSSSQALIDSISSVAVPKKATPAEVLKNLRICFYAITMKGVKSLTPEVLKTYNNFIRYHLESNDIVTRVWALKTATAYSLLYESLSKDVYTILKSQMFKSNNILIWEKTIGCIVDLLLRYSVDKMEQMGGDISQDSMANSSNQNRNKKGGRTLYTDDGDDPEEMDIVRSIDIIQMLTHVLDNNLDAKVHKATLVGLCKLILHGQYCTRDIMSKFLLAYFNPATEPEVNQILGIFFESIIKMKKQESLQEALVPTLVTLLEAPYESPLREVKQETVIKYVIGATRPIFCSNGLNLHNTLALKLIELLKDNPQNKEILKVFSKEFLTLEISDDPLLKMDMVAHIEILLENITADARTMKNIRDFRDVLKGTYKPPLKFSSTGRNTNLEIDEDAGIPEEADEEDNESLDKAAERVPVERFSVDEFLSESNVQMKQLNVKVARLRPSEIYVACQTPPKSTNVTINNTETKELRINAASASPMVSTNANSSNDDDLPELENSEINETSNDVNAMSIQESIDLCESIEIPATQKDEAEANELESEDELEETVIESNAVNVSDEEVELPATPEVPKMTTRGKIIHANKRQLELSLTVRSPHSPTRKNPRNGASPKPFPVSPLSRINLPSPQVVSTPKTSRTRERAAASTVTEMSSSVIMPETPPITVTPKTPKVPKNTSTLVSPRSSRILRSNMSHADSSTSNTERVTRQHSRAELSQSVKLTRSMSKQLNVDNEVVPGNPSTVPKASKVPSKIVGRIVKKSALPVPTKASTLRKIAAGFKQDSGATSNDMKPVAKSKKRTERQQITAARKEAVAAKGKDAKNRPRWN